MDVTTMSSTWSSRVFCVALLNAIPALAWLDIVSIFSANLNRHSSRLYFAFFFIFSSGVLLLFSF